MCNTFFQGGEAKSPMVTGLGINVATSTQKREPVEASLKWLTRRKRPNLVKSSDRTNPATEINRIKPC